MTFQFVKPERVSLKEHPHFSERWVQAHISDDPAILGLGDVVVITTEKLQPRAGRLDMLLHDEQLNRRYEVELMLGSTDPSHIIRCVEYWDIERRRYPAYEHVAVLVAEDITSRFLNIIALFAGQIPIIAMQAVALRVDDKIILHFVRVLDQTALRSDDEFEFGNGIVDAPSTDRAYWEKKTSPLMMQKCDDVARIVNEVSGISHRLFFRKVVISLGTDEHDTSDVWLIPRKSVLRVGGYVAKPDDWLRRFEDVGIPAQLKRGNKAVLASFSLDELVSQQGLLREFVIAAFKPVGTDDYSESSIPS